MFVCVSGAANVQPTTSPMFQTFQKDSLKLTALFNLCYNVIKKNTRIVSAKFGTIYLVPDVCDLIHMWANAV